MPDAALIPFNKLQPYPELVEASRSGGDLLYEFRMKSANKIPGKEHPTI